jgi:hypothetical protein
MPASRLLRAGAALFAALAALGCSPSGTTGGSSAPSPATALDSGAFLVTLGVDTLAAERFTRTANRLEGEVLIRAARESLVRRYAMDYRGDTIVGMQIVTRPAGAPADAPPTQRIDISFGGDSATVVTVTGDSTRTRRVPANDRTIPVMGFMYSPFELAIARARATGADSTSVPMYTLGTAGAVASPVRKIGADSMAITTPLATLRARVDQRGRILGLHAPGSTFQVVLARVPSLDIAALAASAGTRPLGQLSPRDTVRATIGQANLLIDYGRPMRRGRDIFGNVVEWNKVWRTGANTATHFTTDRAITIGGAQVPAGTYTMWSVPSPTGWKLIINRRTKQWGTEYDEAQDLTRVDLQTRSLDAPVEQLTLAIEPAGSGGVLKVIWDRTEASVPIAVP